MDGILVSVCGGRLLIPSRPRQRKGFSNFFFYGSAFDEFCFVLGSNRLRISHFKPSYATHRRPFACSSFHATSLFTMHTDFVQSISVSADFSSTLLPPAVPRHRFFAALTFFQFLPPSLRSNMSQYRHQEIPTAYPAPPPPSYPAMEQVKNGPYVVAPPPVGYPVREGDPQYPHQTFPHQTQSRGDGFWKGCCAALCCCWVLDCVF